MPSDSSSNAIASAWSAVSIGVQAAIGAEVIEAQDARR